MTRSLNSVSPSTLRRSRTHLWPELAPASIRGSKNNPESSSLRLIRTKCNKNTVRCMAEWIISQLLPTKNQHKSFITQNMSPQIMANLLLASHMTMSFLQSEMAPNCPPIRPPSPRNWRRSWSHPSNTPMRPKPPALHSQAKLNLSVHSEADLACKLPLAPTSPSVITPKECASTATTISEGQIEPRTANIDIVKSTHEECARNATVSGIIMSGKARSSTPTIETRSTKNARMNVERWTFDYDSPF